MTRALIASGLIPDTPISRFVSEWFESAAIIYMSQELLAQNPPFIRAFISGITWTTYDTAMKIRSHPHPHVM